MLLIFISTYKKKINFKLFSILMMVVILTVFFSSENLKNRYLRTFDQIKKSIKDEEKNIFINSKHFYNYKLGYDIFKENIFFGVSTKKFRWACKEKKNLDEKMLSFGCSTHPHQTYIEILAEHGIMGFFIIFSSFILFIRKRIKEFFKNKNFIKLSATIYLISLWIPFLPFGSFFSTSAFSLIAINLALARTYNN